MVVDIDIESSIPFVAVWMVTYNHEDYIEQAIESVIKQKTSFNYVLFIGDDCSSDSTKGICISIQNKYPSKINLYSNKINLGATRNGIKTYKRVFDCGAKYIALLEGDDYWTDPYKLQKQVDFLEKNPDFVLCGHSVKVLTKDKTFLNWNVSEKSIVFLDLLKNRNVYTPSLLFTNIVNNIPKLHRNDIPYDLYLKLLLLTKGKGYLMSEPMAVYRKHDQGIWSTLSELKARKNYIKSLRYFLKIFPEYSDGIKKMIVEYKLKYKLFFKDFSIYIFNDLFQILKFGIKRIWKKYKP